MESRVFVYGTLRKDALDGVTSPLTREWRFEGYGTIPGDLYDFGAYPGAVRSDVPDARVRGELYQLPDLLESLDLLDDYEGCGRQDDPPFEFERETVQVSLDEGGTRMAWVYWYRPEPRGRRLVSGDYLERLPPGASEG